MKTIIFILFIATSSLSIGQTKSNKTQSLKKFTEEQAESYVKDYFSFYNSDIQFEINEIRRVQNNVFYVSLKECSAKESCYKLSNKNSNFYLSNSSTITRDDFWWKSKVYVLKINSEKKYTFDLRQ